jgi:hypothetical protein
MATAKKRGSTLDVRRRDLRSTGSAAHDKSKTGKPDRERIIVHEDFELRNWSRTKSDKIMDAAMEKYSRVLKRLADR